MEKLSEVAKDKAEENLYEIISDKIGDFLDEWGKVDDDELEKCSISKTVEDIEDFISYEIDLFHADLQLEMESFNIDSIIQDIDFGSAIDSIKHEQSEEADYDGYKSVLKSEYDEIVYMFER